MSIFRTRRSSAKLGSLLVRVLDSTSSSAHFRRVLILRGQTGLFMPSASALGMGKVFAIPCRHIDAFRRLTLKRRQLEG